MGFLAHAVCLVTLAACLSEVKTLDNDIICPDGSPCPDKATCCKLKSGGYQCCMFQQAVCCNDGESCCPSGYTCGKDRCYRAATDATVDAVPAITNRITTTTTPHPFGWPLTCSDGVSCPTPGSSCCRTFTGRDTCCHYPKNVCCEDGVHCCPTGTVCDQRTLKCLHYPATDDVTGIEAARLVSPEQRENVFVVVN